MKKCFLIIIPLLLANLCKGKDIVVCGSYTASQKLHIKIYEPVNSYYNTGFFSFKPPDRFSIPGTDSFYYRASSATPVTLLIFVTDSSDNFITRRIVVLFPDDSIHLKMDLVNESPESILYSGSNAEGQQLFNRINYVPVNKFKPFIDLLDSLDQNKEHFFEHVNARLENLTSGFDSLYLEKKISKEFRDFQKVTLTHLAYDYIIFKFLSQFKERETLSKETRDKIIASCYEKLPITNPYLKYSYDASPYIIDYYDFLSYKRLSLTSIEPLYKRKEVLIKGKKVTIDNECSQFLYIKDLKVVEELWGDFMVDLLFFIPDGVLTETIQKYKSIFPESKWLPILAKQDADCSKRKFGEYAFSSPVIYVDSLVAETKVSPDANSLQGVFKLLPSDKPVFIDIWASWCGPCVKAFGFNRELDSFLLTNNITKLYISLDGKSQITAWKNAIQRYKLGGFHILANNDLIREIKQVYNIREKEGIAIPRYLLVSKGKNIVLSTASSPLEWNKLKEEINRYLVPK